MDTTQRARVRTAKVLQHLAPEATSGKTSGKVDYLALSKQERVDRFLAVFEELAASLVSELDAFEMPEDAKAYVDKMIHYTLLGGKMNRGLIVLTTYAHLQGRPLSEEEIFKASVLGWCVEWLQSFFLVADDIMDAAHTRRDQPCWYMNEGVGMIAINDSFILEAGVYRLLRLYFRDAPYYVNLLELLLETSFQTELGQLLDLRTSPEGLGQTLDQFSARKHTLVVKYKTAFYSFYLPVALGMTLAGITDASLYDVAREILVDIGIFFQVQDDFLDWWQDPIVLGKVGTDIQDNKCSWPVIQLLDRVTPADRAILEANYAVDDPACIETVKNLYRKYDIEGIYNNLQDRTIAALRKRISKITALPSAVFTEVLNKIAYRQK